MARLVGSIIGRTISCGEVRMRTGDIKRIGKRTYCVMCWTDYDITLQSMDEDRLIVVMPRKFVGGLRKGS